MRFTDFYLNEDITDNENFVKWFGNSKVVDRKGNPVICYHGSGAIENIHSFYDDQFFTVNDYIAQSYAENMGGKVYEVYLKITNPLDFTGGGKLNREKIIEEVYGVDSIQYKNFERYSDGYGLGNALQGDFSKLIKYAKQHGYDGIKFTDSSFDNQIFDATYIVFKSNQIKSVNNNGNFDTNSDNINEVNKEDLRKYYNRIPDDDENYPAIRTKDGELYVDTDYENRSHVMFANAIGLEPEEIESGGWVSDGIYNSSDRSDIVRWSEQMIAKKKILQRRSKLKETEDVWMKSVLAGIDKYKVNTTIIDGDLYLYLYHGTSKANMKKIINSGKFKVNTYFTPDEYTAKRYAQMTGSKPEITYAVVKADGLMFDGNYFYTNRDLELKGGVYQ